MDLYIVEVQRTGYVPVLAESAAEARALAEGSPDSATWLDTVEAVSAKLEMELGICGEGESA